MTDGSANLMFYRSVYDDKLVMSKITKTDRHHVLHIESGNYRLPEVIHELITEKQILKIEAKFISFDGITYFDISDKKFTLKKSIN